MIGDLHCHSKLSDGSTSLEDIVFYAKRAGLDVLALTDHDTMSGISRTEILANATESPSFPVWKSPPTMNKPDAESIFCVIFRKNRTVWQVCLPAHWKNAVVPENR